MPGPHDEPVSGPAKELVEYLSHNVKAREIEITIVRVKLDSEAAPRPPPSNPAQFVPTPFQKGILKALDGKALRTEALADAVGNRSRLFRHPGGLKELRERGLVSHHQRLGYYRADALPPEMDDLAD